VAGNRILLLLPDAGLAVPACGSRGLPLIGYKAVADMTRTRTVPIDRSVTQSQHRDNMAEES
jgi:hypothetical protein